MHTDTDNDDIDVVHRGAVGLVPTRRSTVVRVDNVSIVTAQFHQLLVTTGLQDTTFLEHVDVVTPRQILQRQIIIILRLYNYKFITSLTPAEIGDNPLSTIGSLRRGGGKGAENKKLQASSGVKNGERVSPSCKLWALGVGAW